MQKLYCLLCIVLYITMITFVMAKITFTDEKYYRFTLYFIFAKFAALKENKNILCITIKKKPFISCTL